MSFRTAFAALALVLIGLSALPAQAQHDRRHHSRRRHRPAPRKVIVVEPRRH